MRNLRYAVKVLSEVQTGFGYVIRKEIWPGFGFDVAPMGGAGGEVDEIVTALEGIAEKARHPAEMETCYTTDGDWIGDPDTAKYLCEDRGIYPVHADEIPKGALIPCSVGFCEREQKWYGWSHRAIFGFGINSMVKRGDCGYRPVDRDDYGRSALDFFIGDDPCYLNPSFRHVVNSDGGRGVEIVATYSDVTPNEKLRGKPYSLFRPYPKVFGRGEWVAETLDDARQMAIDFADGVS